MTVRASLVTPALGAGVRPLSKLAFDHAFVRALQMNAVFTY
ncbi:MAG: hypothetical protein QOG01_3687 [Pseudonocardiales bacterium]|jgi:hypothetical protein|nr:hypothetical protein [Pseudonocardiales bacterium]